MTTIRQMLQTSPAKASELFARLVDTSDTAVKTRERFLAALKTELELLARLEEEHLFPVLRKHKDTKELVTGALNDNKRTRKLLAELERIPTGSEEFAPKVVELKTVFQQSVRDERKQLLPAVLKALSDDEAAAIVEKVEDDKAAVEEAERAETDQRRAGVRQERERAQQLLADKKQAADRASKAREVSREAAEQVVQTAEAVTESSVQMAQSVGQSLQRVARGPMSTGSSFWDAMFGMWAIPQARSVGRETSDESSSVQSVSHEEEVIPLAEETLIVGKRTVNSGTTTVRRYVVETPAKQQVTLYDEKVVVERRKPVTDAVTGEVLTELTVEMIETSEVPVVTKDVNVREEVVVRRERTKRVQTVRDTVRRDEIEISSDGERSGEKRPSLAYSRK